VAPNLVICNWPSVRVPLLSAAISIAASKTQFVEELTLEVHEPFLIRYKIIIKYGVTIVEHQSQATARL
jgi:hypothetical protein